MSYLHVAEKNSIAKEVTAILSNNNRRMGHTLSKFNPVYLFQIDGHQHTFSSVRGHIFTYDLPPQCKSWSSYDNVKILTRETTMVKKPGPDMQDLILNLQKLARGKRQLVLWLDCDREGQAIAFEVLEIVQRVNPNIRVHRARFSAVTRADILQAFENLVQPNKLECDAVNYRIEIDFRMGCAFTRYQTVVFSSRYRFRQHSVLSYGPCQMPTLGFVVDRYLQIKNFVPEKYWFILAQIILDEKTRVQLKWNRGNTKNQVDANVMFVRMYISADRGEGRIEGQIIKRNKNQKKKYRPYPLTTVKFQKLATDKLKMSSAQAMKIAEQLYQHGFISYPRTETNSFPGTMNLQSLVKRLQPCESYSNYVQNLLERGNFMKPKVGNQSDQAHSPIHPVKPANKANMSPEQWKVYDLICRHFLACCSKDAVGIESQIVAQIGGQFFKASHLAIKQKNYLQIYPFEKWTESEFPGQIPEYFNASVQLKQSKTQPPGYLTQSELITLMEKNQIGTDSTIHEHIQTIQDRKYAIKTTNTFKPTNLGASLIVTYKNLGIKLEDCHIRRMMQQRMNRIAEGSLDRIEATVETLQEVTPIYRQLKAIENQWLDQMKAAMQQHQSLKQIQIQTSAQMVNRLRLQNNEPNNNDDDVSFTNNTSTIVCYRCGKPGHIAPKCPDKDKPSQNTRQKSKQFHKKNSRQQSKTREINEPRDNQGDRSFKNGIVCYICKEPGHLTTQCQKKNQKYNDNHQNSEKNFKCFICDKQGHFANNCPQKKGASIKASYNNNTSISSQNVVCYSCNNPGHISSNCPNKNQSKNNSHIEDESGVGKTCFDCGIKGRHPRGSNCPQVKRKKSKQPSYNQYQ